MFRDINMLYVYALLGGLVLGGGATFGFMKSREVEPEPVVIPEPVVVTESEVGEKLADIDLLKVPCSSEYISQVGNDLLCREMFCRMQQRGLDSQTSGADCAGISNMNNTLLFIGMVSQHCAISQESTDEYNRCYQRFSTILTTGKSAQ
tara:strand:+ start:2473 stop:2919 length:447 start_codon:yes stop_codon:yes gene_type:complete